MRTIFVTTYFYIIKLILRLRYFIAHMSAAQAHTIGMSSESAFRIYLKFIASPTMMRMVCQRVQCTQQELAEDTQKHG